MNENILVDASEQEVRGKSNGDTVTYKGKQYVIIPGGGGTGALLQPVGGSQDNYISASDPSVAGKRVGDTVMRGDTSYTITTTGGENFMLEPTATVSPSVKYSDNPAPQAYAPELQQGAVWRSDKLFHPHDGGQHHEPDQGVADS